MASKTKSDVKVLKGKEAEDCVLEYVQRMNRPFGATDVSANLKGAVPKTATQKIMAALAEEGKLTMKTYGKNTFFVANQANIPSVASEDLAVFEAEYKTIDEESKSLQVDLKATNTELAQIKGTPTETDLQARISEAEEAIEVCMKRLEPLRAGTTLISAEDQAKTESDWKHWHKEWMYRRKIFRSIWDVATDTLAPSQAKELAEDLGIEYDSNEHATLERGPLCSSHLKRKR